MQHLFKKKIFYAEILSVFFTQQNIYLNRYQFSELKIKKYGNIPNCNYLLSMSPEIKGSSWILSEGIVICIPFLNHEIAGFGGLI